MKYILMFIVFFSVQAYADENASCEIKVSKQISFRDKNSKDVLELSFGKKNYESATLKLSILTDKGAKIYHYRFKFVEVLAAYDCPDYSKQVKKILTKIMNNTLSSSTSLPIRLPCEKNGVNCVDDYYPDQINTYHSPLPVKEYNRIKKQDVPMIIHSVGRESSSSFVYDKKLKKTIQIFYLSN